MVGTDVCDWEFWHMLVLRLEVVTDTGCSVQSPGSLNCSHTHYNQQLMALWN